MKKLFIIGFAMLVLVSSLMVPNQVVSAEVSVTYPTLTGSPLGLPVCEKDWTEGGVTHWRNCAMSLYYTSSDSRLVGTNAMIMHRNIFSPEGGFDDPAVGHGSWVLDAENVEGGWWAGTFTANIDDTGYMTVNIRGKGYGTLKGLFFESTVHSIDGTDTVTVTVLPSYDGPEP